MLLEEILVGEEAVVTLAYLVGGQHQEEKELGVSEAMGSQWAEEAEVG